MILVGKFRSQDVFAGHQAGLYGFVAYGGHGWNWLLRYRDDIVQPIVNRIAMYHMLEDQFDEVEL